MRLECPLPPAPLLPPGECLSPARQCHVSHPCLSNAISEERGNDRHHTGEREELRELVSSALSSQVSGDTTALRQDGEGGKRKGSLYRLAKVLPSGPPDKSESLNRVVLELVSHK